MAAFVVIAVLTVVSSSQSIAANRARRTTTTAPPLRSENPVTAPVDGPRSTTLTRAGSTVKRAKGRVPSISLTGPRGLERNLSMEARTLAQSLGNANTVIDQATLELVAVERRGRIVQITRYPFAFPVSTISLGPIAASALYGPITAEAIRQNEAILSQTSARLRHAEVGDVLVIRHWDRPRSLIRIPVGAIVPDDDAGMAELVLSRNSAAELGFSRPSRIVAWGKIDKVSAAWAKIVPESYLRRSATPPNLDSVLSQAELKMAYGEFIVRRDRGRLEGDPAWNKRNVVAHDYPIIGRVACHKVLQQPLLRALTEIFQAGLSDLINVADTRKSGGCYSAREIRTPTGTSGRNLSRHSWGAAIDLNPSTNPFGRTPTLDPRIVYVFRRNGFAWGGTWSIPDGMHFELIGAPRIAGPPLPVSTTTTSTTTTSTTTTSTTTTSTTTTFTTTTSTSTTATVVAGPIPGESTIALKAASRPSVVSSSTLVAPQNRPTTTTTTAPMPPTATTPPLPEPSAGDGPT